MKHFRFSRDGRKARGGFNLVEVCFAVGLMGCTFVTLMPLLAVGLKSSRAGRNESAAAHIAQNFAEEARQGTLVLGTIYTDEEGAPCPATTAVFSVESSSAALSGSTTQVKFRVVPVGAPDHAQLYALVVPSSPQD